MAPKSCQKRVSMKRNIVIRTLLILIASLLYGYFFSFKELGIALAVIAFSRALGAAIIYAWNKRRENQ